MTSSAATMVRPAVAWYSVGVLLVAFVFSFIDRIILSLLVDPIKADLGVSDTAMGLLMGPAFAIFYVIMGIPIAYLADRRSRRLIIGVGIALWSFATAACGLARTYLYLFLARVGVGVGEAALSPPAYSLISDLFPPEKLGRAVAVYQSGAFFGGAIAFLVGGWVIGLFGNAGTIDVPILGAMRPWQVAFIAVGLPGVLVALAMATVPEPLRRGSLSQKNDVTLRQTWGFMRSKWRLFAGHFVGFALLALPITVVLSWSPVFFGRVLGMTPPEIGRTLGIMLATLSAGGVMLGGWLSDWLFRKGHSDAPLLVGLAAAATILPCGAFAHIVTDPRQVILLYCPLVFFASLPIGTAPLALQLVTPNEMRALVSSGYMLFLNMITSIIGPFGIGLANDLVFKSEGAVGYSIAFAMGVTMPLAFLLLWITRPSFRAAAGKSRDAAGTRA